MRQLDKDNPEQVTQFANDILPKNEKIKRVALVFLKNSILEAHNVNEFNWNVTLYPSNKWIQFCTGHEYCIKISKNSYYILCLKSDLRKIKGIKELKIRYKGHRKNLSFEDNDFEKVPDCLAKVKDSVGCTIDYENLVEYLPILKESHLNFLRKAIVDTKRLPKMEASHSSGFIRYLSDYLKESLPNPGEKLYEMTETEYLEKIEEEEKKVKTMSLEELEKKAKEATGIKKSYRTIGTRYDRSAVVAEYVRRRAGGICEDCKQEAPFINKFTNEPYLEIHHIIPLSEGGDDTPENAVALCPNCHRKRHYG